MPDSSLGRVQSLLTSLADQSLIRAEKNAEGEARFSMLEVVREYAAEQLAARGETRQLQDRHATFFRTFALSCDISGEQQGAWLARLEVDHDNLRATLAHVLATGPVDAVYEIATSLCPLWLDHAHFAEADRWLRTLLSRSEEASPKARADLLRNTYWFIQNTTEARAMLEECVTLYRGLDYPVGLIEGLNRLADRICDLWFGGDSDRAAALVAEALTLARRIEAFWWIGWSTFHLGAIALGQNQLDDAQKLLAEGRAILRTTASPGAIAWVLHHEQVAAHFKGQYDRAAALGEEVLRIEQSLGNAFAESYARWILGLTLVELGQVRSAEALERDQLSVTGTLALPGVQRLRALAVIFGVTDRPLEAARIWGAVETFTRMPAITTSPVLAPHYARHLEAAKSLVTESSWAEAWDEGTRMSREQCLALLTSSG
jgi:hypothetical protein